MKRHMVVGASGLTIEESERKVEELETDEEIEEQVGSCLEWWERGNSLRKNHEANAWRSNVEPAEIQVIVEASDSSDIPEEVLIT